MVAIHVRFSGIGLRGPSLEWAFLWLCCLGLGRLHEHLHEFGEEVLGGRRNKGWSGGLRRSKSLIAPDVRSSGWALAGELIQLSSGIDRSVDARAPPGGARSWSHCEGLIVRSDRDTILPNGLADPLGMELLEL